MSIVDKAVGFVIKYKWSLIIATVVYLLAILFLTMFSSGPQNEPFRYQVS